MIRKFYDVDLDGRSFGNALPSWGKSAEEINTEFRSIISHAFLGCDTINIPKETWELVFDECTKFAQQYANQQPVQGYSEAEAIVKELAQWSEKYPRATVYPMTNKQIDEELITIEEKAKRFTSQQPVNDGWVRVEQRLPEIDFGHYMVSDGESVDKATWVKRTIKESPNFLFTCIKNITHWRPLPEPPKQTV